MQAVAAALLGDDRLNEAGGSLGRQAAGVEIDVSLGEVRRCVPRFESCCDVTGLSIGNPCCGHFPRRPELRNNPTSRDCLLNSRDDFGLARMNDRNLPVRDHRL